MIFHHLIVKLCFLLLVICLGNIVDAYSTIRIRINSGSVVGRYDNTVGQRMLYSSFRGIPYAQPPIGYLRFKPPRAMNYLGSIIATNDHHICAQYDMKMKRVIGSEDCLYLNIYTPEVNFGSAMRSNRAVMVWIHGGAFMWGSKKKSYFGPDFLMEKDVVVVAINYRLGAFGFLAVGKKISGNMGLKDQAMALQWVKDNIANFGGDPNKVTIFGESAGAVSVELQRLSPTSRGLFRGSIAMSGSPLNPWAFASRRDANEMSKDFIKAWSKDWGNTRSEHMEFNLWETFLDELVDVIREYDEEDPKRKAIYQALEDASTEKIAITTQQLLNSQMTIPFLPTTEPSSLSHAFITQEPKDILKNGQCNAVPHILGYTYNEFVGIAIYFQNIYKKLYDVQAIVETVASETFFEKGIDQTRKYLNKYYSNPLVWEYVNAFDYPQSLHKVSGFNEPGCGHADDIAHIFYVDGTNQPIDNTSSISRHRDVMITLWTNFAKELNPTPNNPTEERWEPTALHGYRLKLDNSDRLVQMPFPRSTSEDIYDEVGEYLGF